MGVMKRLSGIIQAKANKALDKAEDPRDTLDLSYEKQLENLQKVRRGLADVATAKKRIELQANQLQAQANKLQDQAKQALGQGREDLAREALTRRSAIAQQLTDLQTQHEQIEQQQQTLLTTSQRLQASVEGFRTKKETLKASYTAAQAQVNIDEATSGISESMGDAGLAMQRAQDKIASMQARAGAMDELVTAGAFSDPTQSDDIQAQLNQASTSADIDAQLAQLQGELTTQPAGQLNASSEAAPASTGTAGQGSDSQGEISDGETIQPTDSAS